MDIATTIEELLGAYEVQHGKQPFGFLCSPGVYSQLCQLLEETGMSVDYGLSLVKPGAPDMFVHGLPLWCIHGYPPGRIDAVDKATADEALEFVGRSE
jgi:hypothetical protein